MSSADARPNGSVRGPSVAPSDRRVGAVFPFESRMVEGEQALRLLTWTALTITPEPEHARATYEIVGFSDIRLARFVASNVGIVRTEDWIRYDRWGATLYFVVAGTSTWVTPTGQFEIGAGGSIALLGDTEFEGHVGAEAAVLQIGLTSRFARERGLDQLDVDHFRFEPTPTALAARALLTSAAGNLARLNANSATFIRRAVEELTFGLILEGLRDRVDTHPSGAIRQRAFVTINAEHTDPDLSPAAVALAAMVSVRHLHRVFAEIGTTVMEEVLRRRTETAVALLSDGARDDASIEQIARLSGFRSANALGRQLRARQGASASEIRTFGRGLKT